MDASLSTRRTFLRQSLALSVAAAGVSPGLLRAVAAPAQSDKVIDIGSRRELLVDDFLIESLGGAVLTLHKPEGRDVVLVCDAPCEGNTSAYYTLFEDDGLFRIYYRGSHAVNDKEIHPELVCYAESRDGLKFEKPKLGLFEYAGSKENNIVLNDSEPAHNFAPFKDLNPACKPEARYKAFAGGRALVDGKKRRSLTAYHSADGIRWSKTREEPVITHGAFDSQNIAYFDTLRGEYRAYWRYFSDAPKQEDRVRSIRTATSKDFLNWENEADLQYGDAPSEHLYTNAIRAYARAPHLYIGFPTRYQPKYQQVEPVFMTSRDGVNFKRWLEEIIPITAPKDRDGNRSNYMTYGLLMLPGNDKELSVYATEAYRTGVGSRVRRFVYRTDGFVSARAGGKTCEMVTKPIAFAGSKLVLNIASKGGARVEIQGADGKPLPGFTIEDCASIKGDFIGHDVSWKGGSLASLAGKPVRLRFVLSDSDLYSFNFAAEEGAKV